MRLRTEGGIRDRHWALGIESSPAGEMPSAECPMTGASSASARDDAACSVLGALNTDDPKSETRNLAAAEGRDVFSAISAVNESSGLKHLDRGLGRG